MTPAADIGAQPWAVLLMRDVYEVPRKNGPMLCFARCLSCKVARSNRDFWRYRGYTRLSKREQEREVPRKNGNMDGFQALYLQPQFAAQLAAGVPIFITGAVSPVKPEKLVRGTFYLLPEK